MSKSPKLTLKKRIDIIEAAYEYMLAYAAQGLAGDEESASVTLIREELEQMDQAMDGLAGLIGTGAKTKKLTPAASLQSFIEVVERDISDTRAAVGLVLGRPKISSQLVDNLNGLIHLRAVLTDMFLIDELLNS